ncbi:MAG: insulinase family protein [Sphingobacteriales bacterium]|nr:insulinase family protein [Sphingobacteriales bacterium]
MKRTIISLLSAAVLLWTNTASAQSKNTTEELMVDGYKVIYKPTTNQIVSVRLFVKGGTANYTKDKEGVENLALEIATNGGTSKYSKSDLNRQLDRMGSSISGSSGLDNANVAMSCIARNFDATWAIFEDVINAPLFSEEEFKMQKDAMVSNVQQGKSDPDTYLNDMAMNDAFVNLNYDKKTNGSEESLAKITLDDVKNHYKMVMNKKQTFIVVVGKIDKAQLIEKVKKMVRSMPEGNFTPVKGTLLTINSSTLNPEDRKMATNYIRGVINGPAYGTNESYAMQLAFGILYDRLFDEIRTKRSLSYAPAAYYQSNVNPCSNVYVTTTDPAQAVQVIIDELKKVKTEGFTETEISNQKSSYVTTYYMGLETNAAQSNGLGNAEVKGSWKNYGDFISNINKVPAKEVNAVVKKYVNGIRWSYLGDLSKVKSDVFLQKL